ncbi:LysR family transcriptional regulator [Vibrio superstes]|uniref:Transcriptional regulator n=1 Tax=Vibrio superstes NBRC 103154 TaxID=1219062 RepID=A0A511QNG2_9VIBR|nr:LysR family transcriptional regulator [Vibrio superstes]GEM78869.1 transcriptional regulator [Vibrio superstes NBRC 103154]
MKSLFDDLNYFLLVVEYGSITKLSNKHNLSATTISRRIALLEDELKVELFSRNGRQLVLTKEGRKFYSSLAQPFSDIRDSLDKLLLNNATITGNLLVSMPAFFYREAMVKVLTEFNKKYPTINIEVDTNYYKNELPENMDLSFIIGTPASQDMISRKITELEMSLIAINDGNAYSITQEYFDSKHFIAARKGLTYSVISQDNERITLNKFLDKQVVVNNADLILESLYNYEGYSYLPTLLLRNGFDHTKFQKITLLNDHSSIPVSAIYRSRSNIPAALRALIDFTVAYFQDHSDSDSQA